MTVQMQSMSDLELLSRGKTLPFDVENSFVAAVSRNAAQYPDSTAVVFRELSRTYAELNRAADCLAVELKKADVAPGDFVCIMMPRCIDYPAAVLGIMKAGAAYIPVDVSYPEERREYMISNSHAKAVVTAELMERSKHNDPADFKETAIDPESPAYMIYTSGSTGTPKGVVVPHRAVAAQAAWLIPEFGLDRTKKNLCLPNFSFDASTIDLLYPLMAGGQIHILNEEDSRDISFIDYYIKEHGITGLSINASLGISLINNYDVRMEYMMLGGEKLTPFRKTETRIYNGYGPTEFAVNSSFHIVDQEKDTDIPIGRPVPNTWSFICDSNGQPVEQGTIGEICLIGPQIAKGYWESEEKTRKSFVKIPFEHSFPYDTMYKTGDLGRYNEDGELMFCGRIDHQVKLRGFRIEMGEIESTVANVPGVLVAAAEVRKINNIDRLCLYYVTDGNNDVSEDSIKEACRKKLASYMIPDIFVRMDRFPLTPNGKIDRKALPEPEIRISLENIVEPANEREQILLNIAKEVLSTDGFGVTDSLSMMGMTSLKAIEIVAKAQQQNILLKIGDVLSRDNIRAISKGMMSVVSWFRPYEKGKRNMVLISGIFAEKYNLPRMELWSSKYNILFIEPVDEHYTYIFKDADYREVVEFYYSLVSLKLEEVSDLNIHAAGGFCFGGLLAYSLSERYYEDTGRMPEIFLGDTAASYSDLALDGKDFEQEVRDATIQLKKAFLTDRQDGSGDDERKKLVHDNAVLMAQKFMIAKKVGFNSAAHKGPFSVRLFNCTVDKDRDLYPGQWKDLAGNLSVIDIEADHFTFCLDLEGKYLEYMNLI